MKFASFPKFSLLSLLAGVLALALAGCGGTSNLALTQGNWLVTAVSGGSAGTFVIGGNLTQSKSTLSGTMYVTGSLCFDSSQSVTMTGTVKGNKVTLISAAVKGQVITISATGAISSLTGTYTIAGGCAAGDHGAVTADAVASLSGTWNGALLVNTAPVVVSFALTQAATASPDGTFALTGTVTYTGSTCSSTASIINPSTVAGSELAINADLGTGTFNYTASLDNPTTPKTISGIYSVSDSCASDADQTVTLTKQ